MTKPKVLFLLLILVLAISLRVIGWTWGLPTRTLSLTTYHPDEAYVFQSFEHMISHRFHPGVGLFYGGFYFHLSAAVVGMAAKVGWVHLGDRLFYAAHLTETNRLYETVRGVSLAASIRSVILAYV